MENLSYKSRDELMWDLWRRAAGQVETSEPRRQACLAELLRTEWSPRFEALMRNRLVMGAIRYGRLRAAGKPTYDRIGATMRCVERYRMTGDLEALVDAANFCLLEFEEGRHPSRHWAAGDDTEHVRTSP